MTKPLKELGYFGDLRRKKGARLCCGVCVPNAPCVSDALAADMRVRCGSRGSSTAGM
jgi:hypothetical protein